VEVLQQLRDVVAGFGVQFDVGDGDLAEFHLGVGHSAHKLFRGAKIVRGLPGLGAYQPVFCGKGGSGSPKRTFQSLLDENLQVHEDIIKY
jgi:hypothetical protein